MADQSNAEVANALLGVAGVIRGLLSGASRDEVLTRHRVGLILCELRRSPRKYGDRAIDLLAAEVGMGAASLYRYAAVGALWTSEDMKAELGRTNRFGQALTWTHFVALAGVREPAVRRALIDQALGNAWSARELRSEIDELENKDARRGGEESPARATLKEGIQTAKRATSQVEVLAEVLSRASSELGEEATPELLTRAIEALGELTRRAGDTLSQLEAVRDSAMQPRVAASSTALSAEVEEEIAQESGGAKRRLARRP